MTTSNAQGQDVEGRIATLHFYDPQHGTIEYEQVDFAVGRPDVASHNLAAGAAQSARGDALPSLPSFCRA